MKYFCFRFDVDTHKCLRDGVPNLLKLAKKLNVKFTFFVNFGQTLNYSSLIKSRLSNSQKKDLNFFPAHVKLGLKDTLFILLLNPQIGKLYPDILKKVVTEGHEIGLHGGKNHEEWLKLADTWPKSKIRNELNWGLNMLKKFTSTPHLGFASPGFNGSEKINKILSELGFFYVADIHSDKPKQLLQRKNKLVLIPTNILGEPNGVGYIEHCRVKKMTDEEIKTDFKKKLALRKNLSTVYDHPYYAGTQALKLVEGLVKIAQNSGYKITTMQQIAKTL